LRQRKDRIVPNGEKNVYLHKKEDLEIRAKEEKKEEWQTKRCLWQVSDMQTRST
jgi:hypothetical protein